MNKAKKIYYSIVRAAFDVMKVFVKTDDRMIIFESEKDFTDNSFALYRSFLEMGLDRKYSFIWAVEEDPGNGIKCIKKSMRSLKTLYYLAKAKYCIYDHNNLYAPLRKKKDQVLVYLGHGAGFKSGKGDNSHVISWPDYSLSTGKMSTAVLAHHWNVSEDRYYTLGTPRLDYYYKDLSKVHERVAKRLHLDEYEKVALWMPTFRKSDSSDISDDSMNNETGLPLFVTNEALDELDSFLREKKALMILKLHHLQSELPSFGRTYTNIKVLRDEDLKEMDVQLYEFVPLSDLLITDYSSISVDYMLLDKPIVYTLDDYEEYNKVRGIWPDNALDYMPGDHIYSVKEFYDALSVIFEGGDPYKEDRDRVKALFHTYDDGKTAERIAAFLKL